MRGSLVRPKTIGVRGSLVRPKTIGVRGSLEGPRTIIKLCPVFEKPEPSAAVSRNRWSGIQSGPRQQEGVVGRAWDSQSSLVNSSARESMDRPKAMTRGSLDRLRTIRPLSSHPPRLSALSLFQCKGVDGQAKDSLSCRLHSTARESVYGRTTSCPPGCSSSSIHSNVRK